MKDKVKTEIAALTDQFVDNVTTLAKQMTLDTLKAALGANVGSYDPALETQPAVTKAAKAATKAARKIAKRSVKRTKKVLRDLRVAKKGERNAQKLADARRAWKLRQKIKGGTPIETLSNEDIDFLTAYNKKYPIK